MNIPMTVEDVRRWMTYLLWQSADIVFYTYKFPGNENNKFIDLKRHFCVEGTNYDYNITFLQEGKTIKRKTLSLRTSERLIEYL
jgi:hypothetical protein